MRVGRNWGEVRVHNVREPQAGLPTALCSVVLNLRKTSQGLQSRVVHERSREFHGRSGIEMLLRGSSSSSEPRFRNTVWGAALTRPRTAACLRNYATYHLQGHVTTTRTCILLGTTAAYKHPIALDTRTHPPHMSMVGTRQWSLAVGYHSVHQTRMPHRYMAHLLEARRHTLVIMVSSPSL